MMTLAMIYLAVVMFSSFLEGTVNIRALVLVHVQRSLDADGGMG